MINDLVGNENLPNVYIREISVEQVGDLIIVKPLVHLYDFRDSQGKTHWYHNERIRKNLKVMIVFSTSTTFNNNVNRGRVALTPKHITKVVGYYPDQVQHMSFSLNGINKQSFDNPISIGGGVHNVFPYAYSFKTTNQQNSSVYAVTYLDIEQVSLEGSLDLSSNNISSYHGAIVGEPVFVNGQLESRTNYFVKQGDSLHYGPVHQHTSGQFMEGSKHSQVAHEPVFLRSAPNPIIKDYRLEFKTKRLKKKRKRPIVSQLYCSVDRHGRSRCNFSLDMEQMFLQNSQYGYMFRSLDPLLYEKIITRLSIKDLSIYRQQVVTKKSLSKIGTSKLSVMRAINRKQLINTKDVAETGILMPKVKYDYQTKRQPSKTLDSQDQTLEEPILCSIKQTQHHFNNNSIVKSICFFDRGVSLASSGEYQYGFEVRYTDPSVEVLQEYLTKYKKNIQKIRNYQARFSRRASYNSFAHRAKINFSNNIPDEAWLEIVDCFIDLYYFMFECSQEKKSAIYNQLSLCLHPKIATAKSVSWVYDNYNFMFSKFQNYFNIDFSTFKAKVKLGNVKNDSLKGKVVIDVLFPEIVDFSDYKASVSFVPESISDLSQDSMTFPLLSYSDYRAMARNEIQKYFNEKPNFTKQEVSFLDNRTLTQLNNIDYHSYTYFSPASMTIGEKKFIDTSVIEQIDLFKFNEAFAEAFGNSSRSRFFNAMSRRSQYIKKKMQSSYYIKKKKKLTKQETDVKQGILEKDPNFINSEETIATIGSTRMSKHLKHLFYSFDSGKHDNVPMSKKDFDMSNKENILSNLNLSRRTKGAKRTAMRGVPLQIKSLMGSKHGFTKNNLFYADQDLFRSPLTKDLIDFCFLSLVRVEYLHGYRNGDIKNPIWGALNSYQFNRAARNKRTLLCRMRAYNNSTLKVDTASFDSFGQENKYFYISANEDSIQATKARAREYQSTDIRPSKEFSYLSNHDDVVVSLKGIVVTQPSLKNGPLGDVDYKLADTQRVNPLTPDVSKIPASSVPTVSSNANPTLDAPIEGAADSAAPSATPTATPMPTMGGGYSGGSGGGY